jgi:hypothetical protein
VRWTDGRFRCASFQDEYQASAAPKQDAGDRHDDRHRDRVLALGHTDPLAFGVAYNPYRERAAVL